MNNFANLPPDCTKSQAATLLYPGLTFDAALPQPWVDAVHAEHHFDVRPHIVWGYPSASIFGRPFAVSQVGQDWLDHQTDKWLADQQAEQQP